MAYRYSIGSNGIPMLNKADIEDKAEETLCYFDESLISSPKAIPILDICDKLYQDFGVQFFYDVDLNSEGEQNGAIVGKCLPDEFEVYIDASIKNDTNVFNFTLGHELGHLTFHQNLKLKEPFPQDALDSIEIDYTTGKKRLISEVDWIEWQANRFSAALLMPRATFRHAVLIAQNKMDIANNLGYVYVDNQAYSIKDFKEIQARLSQFYRTSRTAIEYRMSDLGILWDRRNQNMKHISELFRRKKS